MSFLEIEKSARLDEWSMQDLHSHPHHEIYYLSKGNRKFLLSNALYNIQAPAIIVIPPHVMHKTEGDAFERYNINVAPSYLDAFQAETLEKQALKIIKPNLNEENNFRLLFNAFDNIDVHQKNGKLIKKAIFSSVVLQLSLIEDSKSTPSVTSSEIVPPLLLKTIDYINTHYKEKITLDTIAEEFYVSKGSIIYNFNKYMNCSPIDFLLNVRLTKAKELLINTNKKVDEIAELCGFSSANYFGLIFKQKEDLSPISYRKHERTKI
jgi:AraC-like DNA-binding protein